MKYILSKIDIHTLTKIGLCLSSIGIFFSFVGLILELNLIHTFTLSGNLIMFTFFLAGHIKSNKQSDKCNQSK